MEAKEIMVLIILGSIAIFIAAALIGPVVETIAGTNTSNWTKLTGGSGLVSLYQLLPFVFVAGILIAIAYVFISKVL